jgi:hypothetical protein
VNRSAVRSRPAAPVSGKLPRGEWMLLVVAALAFAHHVDHVLRADNSGWPFTPDVTPFTISLLVYPIFALDFLLLRSRPWVRVALVAGPVCRSPGRPRRLRAARRPVRHLGQRGQLGQADHGDHREAVPMATRECRAASTMSASGDRPSVGRWSACAADHHQAVMIMAWLTS